MLHDVLEMDGYESLESIGSGSFGLIRKVRRKADGVILARKEIDYRKMTTKEKEQLVAEVNILKDLKHPNIVQFLERVIDREHCFIYILMEYCEGGDLASVIKRHREKQTRVPEEFVWNIMVQLILALHECHHGTTTNEETHQVTPRPILHRDLKPDNVFLDGKHNVKLGDFGLSRSLTNPQKAFAQTYVGTPFYMSPELISEFTYDAKSDIWSLGCVIYELCALEPPFLADTQAQLSARIKEGRVKSLPSQYTQDLDNVVKWMLQVNSRKRPTTKDLLNDSRIKNVQTELELRYQTADLQVRLQAQVIREARVTEHEAMLTQVDNDQRSREQKLREQETTLNLREESLRSTDEALRNKEINLANWEQRLIKEQQLLEERIREVLEQEKTIASRKSFSGGSSSTEAMMVDSKSAYDLPSSATTSTNLTAIDTNHTNGIVNKHTRSTGHPSKPTLFPANHKATLLAPNSYSTSMFSASTNATPKGAPDSATGDASNTTRPAPRRKTGLNVGRHSLQTASASRTRTSGGHVSTSTSSHTSTTDAQDKGGLFSGQVSSNPVITQPRPSSVFASFSTIDNASNSSKLYQGQSYTYHGIANKESRLSGRPSLDAPRLRNKSKSASTLVAPLSSTTLSGTGGPSSTTTAPVTSTGNTTSNNNANTNPFIFTDSGKSTTTLPTTSTTTTSDSAADQSNITFGNNSNATFYFTPSATLSSIRAPDKSIDTSDVQMGDTPAESASSSSSSARLSSGAHSTSNNHVRNGISQPHANGVTPASSSSVPAATSSSAVTSIPQGLPSRRSNTSGITASMGHIRFQPQSHPQTTTGSGSASALTNGVAPTAAAGAATQATASTSAADSAATGMHDGHLTTTPIKFHIGSGGGNTSGSGSRGNGGTVPHILGADRFSRDSTPPPSGRSHHKHNHHSHHQHHHHQYQQQQQQHQQHQQETHYRDADDDLRMEWDGDIPSPFIKKTYNRPLGGGVGGISPSSAT
ncbi:G2-specific serine/threonine protein kinase, partial [Linnemannia exigua]